MPPLGRLLAGASCPIGECCSSVVARGWVCTIGTFLKVGQSHGSMISLLLLSQTRPTCTHHVEVLCFRLFPRFS